MTAYGEPSLHWVRGIDGKLSKRVVRAQHNRARQEAHKEIVEEMACRESVFDEARFELSCAISGACSMADQQEARGA
jgi:hypothetical protein